jgi:hypothetical protein
LTFSKREFANNQDQKVRKEREGLDEREGRGGESKTRRGGERNFTNFSVGKVKASRECSSCGSS